MRYFPPAVLDRRIRFALVGCGRIAANHFNAIDQHAARCELVGVCDVDPQALSRAAESTGARPYRSLGEMLSRCDADAVIVATPSGLHPEQAIQIAAAGRHVITEKPMATRWEDGKRMVGACDAAGVRMFVVKQNRRNATLQLLKRAVDKKRFGRIYMVNLNVFWTRPDDYYNSAKWRGTWEYDGGAFMNQASHYVDLIDWIVGPVESLQAYTATLARDIEVEDTGVISLRWRNGALGSMNVTMLTYPRNMEGSITILGETGTARIGGVAVNEVQQWEFATPDEDDALVHDASYQTTSVYGFGHPLYYDNVIKVLRGEAEPETDGREGLKSLEVLVAAYKSARDGKRVALPLEY
jgi:UDP-N-acetyl-2-amino-2-deoxyglucuronate dehydrogenase